MNNIEILEMQLKKIKNFCKDNKHYYPEELPYYMFWNGKQAEIVENLIKENKELKEKAKNTMKLIGANYIHKNKVKEKIEVLKMNADYDWIYKYDYKDVIKMLQQLLEGDDK